MSRLRPQFESWSGQYFLRIASPTRIVDAVVPGRTWPRWEVNRISTFEDGWICNACWTANRANDLRCYRCASIQPGYHEVPVGPRRSVLRPILDRGERAVDGAIHAAFALLGRQRRVLATATRGITSAMVSASGMVGRGLHSAGQLLATTARPARSSVRTVGRLAASTGARLSRTIQYAAVWCAGLVRTAWRPKRWNRIRTF